MPSIILAILALLFCASSALELSLNNSCKEYCTSESIPLDGTSEKEDPPATGVLSHTVASWIHQEYQFYMYLLDIFQTVLNEDLADYIESYLDLYEEQVLNSLFNWGTVLGQELDVTSVSKHPFLIFKMLRRLVLEYPDLQKALSEEFPQNVPDFFDTLPRNEDLAEYTSLLVSLKYLSSFNISDFCRGTFGQIVTNISLSASESLSLAQAAFNYQFYSSALEFLVNAQDVARDTGEFDPENIENDLAWAVIEHDANWNTKNPLNYDFYTKKLGSVTNYLKNRGTFITKLNFLKSERSVYNHTGEVDNLWTNEQYQLLCSGRNFQTENQKRRLKCWYNFLPSGIFPYKMELLNEDPRLLKIHEFLRPRMAIPLKKYLLKTGQETYAGFKGDEAIHAFQGRFLNKLSTYTRFDEDFENPQLVKELEREVSLISNLDASASHSELLHASSSLPGAVFGPHHDSHDDYETLFNFRLATMLIYLGDTIMGGRTAFYNLGLSVEPEPYSAILWDNRRKNCEVEVRNFHGGCPVILGDKWLSNKWIIGSIQDRRCSTNPLE
ncbi:unnamed protein product [Allacma fusca]|uniref:Prolyl 4-hydroxylase alpha subunit domain-containing protein n=1 Tax=Allacma fusca TaxID=39272 RepID=A0A8J2JQF0_9HEXA|nr:unnamed protein product [Allacma fusca]